MKNNTNNKCHSYFDLSQYYFGKNNYEKSLIALIKSEEQKELNTD
ncbi:MAG: hypothetical protein LEGION0398_MBIBDBAK_00108 [Legionellaceae bacterium]